MSLSTNKRRYKSNAETMLTRHMTVATGKTVYEGAIVEISSGYIQPAAGTGLCMGIAAEYGVAGDEIKVEYGHVEVLDFDGTASASNNGAILYAAADDKVRTTSGTTIVGKQIDLVDDSTLASDNTRVRVLICLNN